MLSAVARSLAPLAARSAVVNTSIGESESPTVRSLERVPVTTTCCSCLVFLAVAVTGASSARAVAAVITRLMLSKGSNAAANGRRLNRLCMNFSSGRAMGRIYGWMRQWKDASQKQIFNAATN